MPEESISERKIRKLTWSESGRLIKTTFREFFQEKSFFHGAALAYYTIFAMVPMIYLALISFGQIVGQDTVLKIIDGVLKEQVGLEDTKGLMSFLRTVNFEKGSVIMNIVGIIALLISSSALLTSLRASINDFFDINIVFEDRRKAIFHNVGSRLVTIVFLPILGLLVIVTYFGETVVLSFGHNLFDHMSYMEDVVLGLLQHVLAILTNVLLFAAIFKYLHDGIVAWKLALAGATVTAILLYLGQLLIKFYLKNYFFGSSAGVPGTLLVLLAWMYYSSQIIFLGAKFTKVYADAVGRTITFAPHKINAKHFFTNIGKRRT